MKTLDLGPVVGSPGKNATINGYNAVKIQGDGAAEVIQDGDTLTIRVKQQAAVNVDQTLDGNSTNAVSGKAVKAAIDSSEANAKSYTDQKLADLSESSSDTLNAIEQIKNALEENPDVVSALETIAQDKVSREDFETHANSTDNPHHVTAAQVGAETPAGAQEKATAALDAAKALINTHVGNKNNPHGVTADVIGAETPSGAQLKANAALAQAKSYTDTKINSLSGLTPEMIETLKELAADMDNEEGILGMVNEAIGTRASKDDLEAHVKNTSNPHGVTATQVGADPAGSAEDAYNRAKQYIDTLLAGGAGTGGGVSSEELDNLMTQLKSYVDLHTSKTNNPHRVTAEQVGADPTGSAASALASAKSLINSHTSNTNNPHSVTAAQVGADAAGSAKAALDSAKVYTDQHATDTNNPHHVTAEQLGAETAVGAQAKATAALTEAKKYTDSHVANKENPHEVTAEQVGAETPEGAQQKVDTAVEQMNAALESHKTASNPHGITAAMIGAVSADEVDTKDTAILDAAKAYSDEMLSQTKTYVDGQIGELVGATGEAMDALNQLAAAISSNPEAIEALTNVAATKADKTALDAHIANQENPHGVTAAQVGAETPTGAQEKANAALAEAKNYVDTHSNNKSNPHGVTVDQIGAETPTGAQQKATQALNQAKTYADTHINDKANPHNVTKDQIGLDRVENKSSNDIRQEISKADITRALGYTPPAKDTTYANATHANAGLMSAADKMKLDNLYEGAVGSGGSGNSSMGGIGTDTVATPLIEAKRFRNIAPGWNTVKFTESFDTAPVLHINTIGELITFIQVKNITKDSFMYQLRVLNEDSGKYEATSDTTIEIDYIAIENGGDE